MTEKTLKPVVGATYDLRSGFVAVCNIYDKSRKAYKMVGPNMIFFVDGLGRDCEGEKSRDLVNKTHGNKGIDEYSHLDLPYTEGESVNAEVDRGSHLAHKKRD